MIKITAKPLGEILLGREAMGGLLLASETWPSPYVQDQSRFFWLRKIAACRTFHFNLADRFAGSFQGVDFLIPT